MDFLQTFFLDKYFFIAHIWENICLGAKFEGLRDIRVPDFSVHTFSPGLYSPVAKWTFQSKTLQSWTFQSKTFQSWTFQSKTFQSWTFQSQTFQSWMFQSQTLQSQGQNELFSPRPKWQLFESYFTFFDRIWLTRFSLPCSFKHMPSIWFLR